MWPCNAFVTWLAIDISIKAEVVIRIGLCVLISVSLCVADIPQVVPPSLAFLTGVLGTVLGMLLPMLMFIFGAALPSTMVILILGMLGSSMLLCAASVSDGLFCAIFSVYAVFMTALYGGETYQKTSGMVNALISFAALLSLSYRQKVQQGGLDTVGSMWTESGLTNGNAVYRNILIAICWGFVSIIVPRSLPPFRTSRSLIGRTVLPGVLHQVVALLNDKLEDTSQLVHVWNKLDGGSIAGMTLFEPRIFTSWTQDLVTPLQDLILRIDELILDSFMVFAWESQDANDKLPDRTEYLEKTTTILNACASALSSNDPEQIESLQDLTETTTQESSSPSSAYDILQQAASVRVATLAWLQALNHPKDAAAVSSKEKASHLGRVWSGWLMGPLLPLKRLAAALLIDPFYPSRWSLTRSLWSLKLAIGHIALFIMSVYWTEYSTFRLKPQSDSKVGAVWSGWQLLGYSFSLLPTKEGSAKKGLQRVLGTAIGGFAAWLGIIVCSWSYDDDAPINPYGLVAWLTVTTMLCSALFTVDKGLGAQMGASSDRGFTGIGFAGTQTLIALEVYAGLGDKEALTVNRIVAITVGVVMAVVLVSIPPVVRGNDPQHVGDYLTELDKAFLLLLRTFVSDYAETADADFRSTLLKSAPKYRRFAVFLLEDASHWKKFPLYKVNEQLKPLTESMFVTESMIDQLNELLAGMITAEKEELELARGAVEQILAEMDGNKEEQEVEAGVVSSGASTERVHMIRTFVNAIRDRLKDHTEALEQLR